MRNAGAAPGQTGVLLVGMAVAEGFEPSEAFTSHAFEACSLGRSDTPPPGRVPNRASRARIGSAGTDRSSSDHCLAAGIR